MCSYRLWDAYGVLPLVCGIKPQRGGEAGGSGTAPSHCVMDAEQVLAMIHQSKVRGLQGVYLVSEYGKPWTSGSLTLFWRAAKRLRQGCRAGVGHGLPKQGAGLIRVCRITLQQPLKGPEGLIALSL